MIIYDSIYSILNQYIYGNPDVLSAFQELTLVELSTVFSVFVCSLPIITVFALLKFFLNTIGRY